MRIANKLTFVKVLEITNIHFMATSTVIYQGDLRTECTHLKSGQTIITDAPTDNHGMGEAFSPTDLAATSLGCCMITVMNIAANGRGITIEKMRADVTKVMAANPRRISEITVDVKIEGEFSQEQKRLLEDIGRNCPVALSLHPDIKQNITFHFE